MAPRMYRILEALGHRDRAAILVELVGEEATEKAIAERLAMRQTTATRHLARLSEAGLIERPGSRGAYRPTVEEETRRLLEAANRLALAVAEVESESDREVGESLRRSRLSNASSNPAADPGDTVA